MGCNITAAHHEALRGGAGAAFLRAAKAAAALVAQGLGTLGRLPGFAAVQAAMHAMKRRTARGTPDMPAT